MDRAFLDDFDRRREHVRIQLCESLRRRLDDTAGTHAGEMLATVDDAASFLSSADPLFRCGAIIALTFAWHVSPGSGYAAKILDVAQHDTDPHVRREALGAIGLIYKETDDVQVGYMLARTVLNDFEAREPS